MLAAMQLSRLVAALAVAWLAAQLVALTGSADPIGVGVLVDPFFASSLAGAALIGLVSLPRRPRAFALLLGIALEVLFALLFPHPFDAATWIVQRGAGLGLATLAVLASQKPRDALWGALVLPLFVAASSAALDLTTTLHPRTFDGACLRIDALLGQPSFAAGRLFLALPALGQICAVIYGELPLFCAAVWLMERRRVEVLTSFVALGVAGYALYHLFPVAGPKYAFATWPGSAPAVAEWFAAAPPAPRNCMPSLHSAWVILCALHARRSPAWFRALSWAWVAGTLLATLGLGLHYAIDLIAALPFLGVAAWAWRTYPAPSLPRLERIGFTLAGLAFSSAAGAMVTAGALPSTIVVAAALAGLIVGMQLRGRIGVRAIGLTIGGLAAASALSLRLLHAATPVLGVGGGAALAALPAVFLPALLLAAVPMTAASGFGAAAGALAASLLLPALGRSATAVVLALPACLASWRAPGELRLAPPSETQLGSGASAATVGALTAALALACLLWFAAAGNDYLTAPLFFAVFIAAFAWSAGSRMSASARAAALLLGGSAMIWAWPHVPGYLASFAGYPAVRTLGTRAVVRLGVALFTIAPAALAAGLVVSMTRPAAKPFCAGALAAALAFLVAAAPSSTRGTLEAERAPVERLTVDAAEFSTRESWALVRARLGDHGVAALRLPLDELSPGELRTLLVSVALELPHLALDGDQLLACKDDCPGARLEVARLLPRDDGDGAELAATDDNLVLAEARRPLAHANVSREKNLELLRSLTSR